MSKQSIKIKIKDIEKLLNNLSISSRIANTADDIVDNLDEIKYQCDLKYHDIGTFYDTPIGQSRSLFLTKSKGRTGKKHTHAENGGPFSPGHVPRAG